MVHSQLTTVRGKTLTQPSSWGGFVSYPSWASIPVNDSSVDIVDSDAVGGPVAVQVLQAFNIPVLNANLLNRYADLPGYDIYNQDCLSIMQLSLATQFLDNNIMECYIDENGLAYFVIIGQDVFQDTDSIRYWVPTTRKNTPVDAVFVRGLKPAVRRELRERIDGMPDAETIDWTDCKREVTCEDKNYANFGSVMYTDPVLSSTYYDGIIGSYEKQDWESVLGFVVDLKLPKKDDYTDLQITFSREETRYPVSVDPFALNKEGVELDTILYEDCEEPTVESERLYGAAYGVGPFLTDSIYEAEEGKQVSDFIAVEEVYIIGRKIIEFRDYTALYYRGWSGIRGVGTVEEQKSIYSLDYGKNWLWEKDKQIEGSGIVYITFTDRYNLWSGYSGTPIEWRIGGYGGPLVSSVDETSGIGRPIPGMGDPMGYLIYQICVIVSRRRPSVTVTTTDGKAFDAADGISIEYIPIVIVDEPPPVGYAYAGGTGILDQREAVFDTDPTTVQSFGEVKTDYDRIIDATNGVILDITLPFAEENDCRRVAKNIYNYSIDSEVDSMTYILGPDAYPRLGQQLNGDTINEISFSYQDSSSYLITATTGPQFLGMNSWSNSQTMLKTEEVTRNGKVVKDMGDGSTYVVKLDGGMGEIVCLSTILERIEVGDTVSVTIYNNPVEAP